MPNFCDTCQYDNHQNTKFTFLMPPHPYLLQEFNVSHERRRKLVAASQITFNAFFL